MIDVCCWTAGGGGGASIAKELPPSPGRPPVSLYRTRASTILERERVMLCCSREIASFAASGALRQGRGVAVPLHWITGGRALPSPDWECIRHR